MEGEERCEMIPGELGEIGYSINTLVGVLLGVLIHMGSRSRAHGMTYVLAIMLRIATKRMTTAVYCRKNDNDKEC